MELKLKKFSAPWCGQCRALSKEFERNSLNCNLQEVNVDDLDDEVLESINIKSIPVCILYDVTGEPTELKRWIGMVSTEEINNYIKTCS